MKVDSWGISTELEKVLFLWFAEEDLLKKIKTFGKVNYL